MKYFGIGLSKTGTSSLFKAFLQLGFSARHYLDAESYRHMINGTQGYNYDFVNDVPIYARYQGLDRLYPGSKFIHTVRDVDKWLNSCKKHWDRTYDVTKQNWLDYRYEIYGQKHYDAETFRRIYDQHNRDVQEYFKHRPDDLLIMDVTAGDGWELLCPFIGCDEIPQSEFPHANAS